MPERAAPLVSVVIPTHNRAGLVKRAIESVLVQTVQDFELLVVDDCSVDGTRETVHQFHDPRVSYFRHEVNRGPGAARNTGILAARGEYLAFLDSDDEWMSRFLERHLDAFWSSELPRLGLVACDAAIVGPDGAVQGHVRGRSRGWLSDHLLQWRIGLVGTPSTWLVRNEGSEAPVLFDETLPAIEDWDYQLRFGMRYQVDFLAETLVVMHEHSGEHVHQAPKAARARAMLIEKYRAPLRQNRRTLATHHVLTACWYSKAGERSKMFVHLARALQARPWDPRHFARLVLAIAGFSPDRVTLGRWMPGRGRRED